MPEPDHAMQLWDYLCVPYRLEASLVATADGAWRTALDYPELPGCRVEAATLESALTALERRRLETIVAMLVRGATPPVPRPPLSSSDPLDAARAANVEPDVLASIERQAALTGSRTKLRRP